MPGEKRKTSRTKLWFHAEAIVKSDYGTTRGKVDNLGAKGMFVETAKRFAENSEVEIRILFKSEIPSQLEGIKGTVTRNTYRGMGIRFTEIDLDRFRECMISIMEA